MINSWIGLVEWLFEKEFRQLHSYPIHIHEPDLNVGARAINGGAVLNGSVTAASFTANNPNSIEASATLADANSTRLFRACKSPIASPHRWIRRSPLNSMDCPVLDL